ncbi:MAG: four helix bundle protein, partial [Polyangiales bacterium]
ASRTARARRPLATLRVGLRLLDPTSARRRRSDVPIEHHVDAVGAEGFVMLNIYPVVLEIVAASRPLLVQIERRDRDLGRQLRRAVASVALNLAEGMYSRGALRTARYHTALGSMRETTACFEVARAFGYIGELDSELQAKLHRVTGTLVRLVDGPR